MPGTRRNRQLVCIGYRPPGGSVVVTMRDRTPVHYGILGAHLRRIHNLLDIAICRGHARPSEN